MHRSSVDERATPRATVAQRIHMNAQALCILADHCPGLRKCVRRLLLPLGSAAFGEQLTSTEMHGRVNSTSRENDGEERAK